MNNQWALITGGASGIGLAIAQDLARQGAHLVIVDLHDHAFDALRGEFDALGVQCLCYQADVSQIGALQAVQDDLAQRGITARFLVTAAGILQPVEDIRDFDLALHERVWRINYDGTYHACKVWLEPMRAAGQGAILVVSSIMAYRSSPLLAYAPAKAALNSLVSGLAVSAAPGGVRINAIAPGFTLTKGLQQQIDSGQRDSTRVLSFVPMKRFVSTDEVARTARFLLSDDASAITGITLPVDCGWLAGTGWVTFKDLP
ncbi:SDR family NAD(P)-dependent oxidoreductase [Castellaniella sp.]|uniref:SDR family NAD(P)-dependent oxidoreductase n=1 Tax=Castellaniella sp. TaxID=1955812 RepID=UPI00356366EC